jgi:hypothetical protein
MQSIKKAPESNYSDVSRTNAVDGCPLTAALAALGGKWKLIIVYWLAAKTFCGAPQSDTWNLPKGSYATTAGVSE